MNGMRLIRATSQKARKPYKCGLCGRRIKVGDAYEREQWDDLGKRITLKFHTKCEGEEMTCAELRGEYIQQTIEGG